MRARANRPPAMQQKSIEAGDGAETSGEPDENADDATSSPRDVLEGEEASPDGLDGALEPEGVDFR
jgi:hypothetical protein